MGFQDLSPLWGQFLIDLSLLLLSFHFCSPSGRCFSEFSEPFDYSDPPITASESTYLKTQAASPIAHVQKIKANVLILLGLEDKRVPPQQARLLYHALKSKGKNVRMLAFENADHALETVQAEWNGWEASFKQFQEALKNCGTWIS